MALIAWLVGSALGLALGCGILLLYWRVADGHWLWEL